MKFSTGIGRTEVVGDTRMVSGGWGENYLTGMG